MSVRTARNEETLTFSGDGHDPTILLRQLAAAIEAEGADPTTLLCSITYDGNDGIEFLLSATVTAPHIKEGT